MWKSNIKEYDDENVPECVEVKLAYDLAAIPVLGILFYTILFCVVFVKIGENKTRSSCWMQKAKSRLWTYTGKPFVMVAILFFVVGLVVPSFLPNETCNCEKAAPMLLRHIVTAQATYTTQYKRYAPSLAILASSGILQRDGFNKCDSPGVDSQAINGYIFQMTAGQKWTPRQFYVRCRPETPASGTEFYATDANGKIVTTKAYATEQ